MADKTMHLMRTPTTVPIVLLWCGMTAEQARATDYIVSDPARVTCPECLRVMQRDFEMLARWIRGEGSGSERGKALVDRAKEAASNEVATHRAAGREVHGKRPGDG